MKSVNICSAMSSLSSFSLARHAALLCRPQAFLVAQHCTARPPAYYVGLLLCAPWPFSVLALLALPVLPAYRLSARLEQGCCPWKRRLLACSSLLLWPLWTLPVS